MKLTRTSTRFREKCVRLLNAGLLRLMVLLHRRADLHTVYNVGRDGVTATFEGIKFRYSFADYGCTGNIDYEAQAENETREALIRVLGESDVFFDIGAHGGVYSLTLKHVVPGLVIHSFEPLPEELMENFALNNRSTANVHHVAVGDVSGTAKMTTSFRSSNHLGTVDLPGDRDVMIVRLDDYVVARNLPSPQWIKIDIEGMELPALRGAEQLLRKSKPVVICEINHLVGRYGASLSDMTAYMESLGYDFFSLSGQKLMRIPFPCKNLADVPVRSADNNYWFVPRGRPLEPLIPL